MKIKLFILLFGLLFGNALFAQKKKSPIHWINNIYYLNIDTSNYKTASYPDITIGNKTKFLNYTFKNIGKEITFLDTILWGNGNLNQFITKPNETTTISLKLLGSYYKEFDLSNYFYYKKDTTVLISLPFYYKKKTYNEEVTFNLTFGKGKLIEYDSLHFDVTHKMSDLFQSNTPFCYECTRFVRYITIKNISQDTILCSASLKARSNIYGIKNSSNPSQYVQVLPGEIYQIPLDIDMKNNSKFELHGIIEIISKEITEVYSCTLISDFIKK